MEFQEISKLLEGYGIKIADYRIAKDKKGVFDAASTIGYPIAIKVISPDIIHKTDKGCVKLDLKDEKELSEAYDEIKKNAGDAKIEGFIVQKMAEKGVELLVGGKKDAVFGQVVVFGVGGIFVEVFKDISMRVCPITKKDAEEMINEIKGYPLLQGVRGMKPVDLKAIISLLVNVSKLLDEHQEIKELDLNPVIGYENGYLAVDARVVV